MRKSMISIFLGSIFIAALAMNAHAQQMCGCRDGYGGGMGGGLIECMGQQGMGMMHGIGGLQGGGVMEVDNHPPAECFMTPATSSIPSDWTLASRWCFIRMEWSKL